MILDCDRYRINVKTIERMTRDKTPEERVKLVGALSATLDVPIIIVFCYVGELYGFTKEINEYIAFLKKFYHNDKVINIHSVNRK